MLTLSRPWTEQNGNKLLHGIEFNVARVGPWTKFNGVDTASGRTRWGPALRFTTNVSSQTGVRCEPVLSGQREYTLVAALRIRGWPDWNVGVLGCLSSTGATKYVQIVVNWLQQIVITDTRLGASVTYAAALNTDYGLVAVGKPNGSVDLYINGRLVASQTGTAGAIADAGQFWQVGTFYDNSIGRTSSTDVSVSAVLWNAIGPDAALALSQDPPAVFAPRKTPIFYGGEAATAPTITALSARLITSSSAQPRISYS